MNKRKQPTNDNISAKEVEETRLKVINLELEARFLKAQYEIRYYTLEAGKLQGDYEKYMDGERQKYIDAINRMKQEASENVKGDPSEAPDENKMQTDGSGQEEPVLQSTH